MALVTSTHQCLEKKGWNICLDNQYLPYNGNTMYDTCLLAPGWPGQGEGLMGVLGSKCLHDSVPIGGVPGTEQLLFSLV